MSVRKHVPGRGRVLLICAALGVAAGLLLPAALAASRSPSLAVPATAAVGDVSPRIAASSTGGPATADGDYLSIGDSITFGYNPLVRPRDLSQFVGYSELAAPRLGLHLTNLSCPGQTSASFLDRAGADNGCLLFRAVGALHTPYTGTQAQATHDYLVAHPRTRLVTITLGGNDFGVCRKNTADRCTSPAEYQSVFKSYAANLTEALSRIRAVYHGRLVVVTYYPTDFTNAGQTQVIRAVNSAAVSVVGPFHTQIADGYRAFEAYAARFGGKPCDAGLLIKRPGGGCDLHPSRQGATLLADAVVAAVQQPAA